MQFTLIYCNLLFLLYSLLYFTVVLYCSNLQ